MIYLKVTLPRSRQEEPSNRPIGRNPPRFTYQKHYKHKEEIGKEIIMQVLSVGGGLSVEASCEKTLSCQTKNPPIPYQKSAYPSEKIRFSPIDSRRLALYVT